MGGLVIKEEYLPLFAEQTLRASYQKRQDEMKSGNRQEEGNVILVNRLPTNVNGVSYSRRAVL